MDTELLKKLDPFFRQYKPLYYKKGQIIIRPENNVEHIYFIEKGFVKFYSLSEDGKEFTFLIYKPGYIFPVVYTFIGDRTRYYFEAMTPVVLRRITKETFTEIANTNPTISFAVGQEIVIRLEEVLNRMEMVAFGNAYKNVASIVNFFGLQFGKKSGNSVTINLPIAHKDIASMAGLARETVSVEMKKLETQGLIKYKRNHITIKDLSKFAGETGIEF